MSDSNKRGPKPKEGFVIKVRVSRYVRDTYLPAMQALLGVDRGTAAGMVIEAAAAAQLPITPKEQ